MVFAQKPAKLKAAMADVLENAENTLTPMMRNMIDILWDEWKTVEPQIDVLTDRLEQIASSDADCYCIRQIPGIGPIVATAIVAAIGNGAAFRKGRDFAAWLGLVPRQYSTGGKAKFLGISKRGNTYLRKILIHGARAAAMRIRRDRFVIGGWMNALEARAPRNVLVVAMANKLARIAWAVLSTGEDYRPGVIASVAAQVPSELILRRSEGEGPHPRGCQRVMLTAPRGLGTVCEQRSSADHAFATIKLPRSLHWNSKDERTVTTACLQLDTDNGP